MGLPQFSRSQPLGRARCLSLPLGGGRALPLARASQTRALGVRSIAQSYKLVIYDLFNLRHQFLALTHSLSLSLPPASRRALPVVSSPSRPPSYLLAVVFICWCANELALWVILTSSAANQNKQTNTLWSPWKIKTNQHQVVPPRPRLSDKEGDHPLRDVFVWQQLNAILHLESACLLRNTPYTNNRRIRTHTGQHGLAKECLFSSWKLARSTNRR